MESESITKKYILNQDITVVIEAKKEKGLFKNKVVMTFEAKDGTPLEFENKKAIRDFLEGLDYEDNQLDLLDQDEEGGTDK